MDIGGENERIENGCLTFEPVLNREIENRIEKLNKLKKEEDIS